MLSGQLKLLLSAVHADAGIQVRRYRYFSPKTVGLDYKVSVGFWQPCNIDSNLVVHRQSVSPAHRLKDCDPASSDSRQSCALLAGCAQSLHM